MLASILFAVPAYSEQTLARKDHFIVKYAVAGLAAYSSTDLIPIASESLRVSQSLGGGTAALLGPKVMAAHHATGSEQDEIVSYEEAKKTCDQLVKLNPVISHCEPDAIVTAQALPNDPQLANLWGLGAAPGANLIDAWDHTTGSGQVVVAVIDTGVDYTHPELAANMWVNPFEIPGNGIDDDGNGFVDDIYGANFFNSSGNPYDDNSHGTHVAGTIGALGNNSSGVAGINWNVKIMALKFLSSNGSGSISGAIAALDYLIAMKARGVNVRISNNSWGGPVYSKTLQDAITRARDAGIIFVAAAGNEANDNDARPSYPASYDLSNVISVAAIDRNGNLARFSNYGANSVDIAAPGVEILSTTPKGGYATFSGTSMATPHVAGALALLLSTEPHLSDAQLLTRLYDTGYPLGSLNGVVRTGRTLNAYRLITGQAEPLPQPTPEPAPCSYAVQESILPPDTRADSAAAVIDYADEGNFATVGLPFDFTFDGTPRNSVTLSPNGVLYFGTPASSLDWQNFSSAPINSVAALHSDLKSTVRSAYNSDNSLTLAWSSTLFGREQLGTVNIRTTLLAGGAIRTWVNFSSEELRKLVIRNATIGLTGRTAGNSITYAHNSKRIVNGLALEFTPICSSSSVPGITDPRVASLSIWGNAGGRSVPAVIPGNVIGIKVKNAGPAGNVRAMMALDNETCAYSPLVTLNGNSGTFFRAKAPRILKRFKNISVTFQNSKRKLAIQSSSGTAGAVRGKKLGAARFDALCTSLAKSLRRIR